MAYSLTIRNDTELCSFSNYTSHNAYFSFFEIVLLTNDIERFQTFLYKLYSVFVAARQNIKGGKKNT